MCAACRLKFKCKHKMISQNLGKKCDRARLTAAYGFLLIPLPFKYLKLGFKALV